MSFSLYKELHSATAGSCSSWARLLPGNVPQLVACRGTVLDIWTVGDGIHTTGDTDSRAQLQLLATFTLAGNVASLEIVRLSKRAAASVARQAELEAILLTFKDAKVSLVGLDPFSLKLKSLAMLNFEEGALGPGCTVQARRPYLHAAGAASTASIRVDPDMRCAAIVPYDEQIAVIPFTKEVEGLDELDSELEDDAAKAEAAQDESARVAAEQERLTRAIFRKPYIIEMKDVGVGLAGKIPDMALLHGYSVEPTLCVLVERALTTAARLASLQHTYSLCAISLDLQTQNTPVVWQKDGLPHDSFALIPIPSPIGGVLVVTPSAVLYFNQQKYAGLALNGFAAYTVDVKGRYRLDTNLTHDHTAPSVCLSLDACRHVMLTPTRILFIDKNGGMNLLKLHTAGAGELRYMTMHPAGIMGVQTTHASFWPASAAASQLLSKVLPGATAKSASQWLFGLLFQSSRSSDSSLSLCAVRVENSDGSRGGATATSGSGAAGGAIADAGEDDEMLYGSSAAPAAAAGSDGDAAGAESAAEDTEMTGDGSSGAKRARIADASENSAVPSTAVAKDEVLDDEEDEDLFLYGTSSKTIAAAAAASAAATEAAASSAGDAQVEAEESGPIGDFLLFPADSLPSLGPARETAMARCSRLMTDDDEEPPLAPPPTELLLTSGEDQSGCIAVVHKSLRPVVASQLRLAGCVGMWSLPFKAALPDQPAPRPMPPSATAADGADADGMQQDADEPSMVSGFVFISTASSTRVLSISEGIAEVEPGTTEIETETRTLAAGVLLSAGNVLDAEADMSQQSIDGHAALDAPHSYTIADGSLERIVQVHDGGVRVLEATPSARAVQEVILDISQDIGGLGAPPGVTIAAVQISDPFVMIRLGDGSLRLLQASATDGELLASDPAIGSSTDPVVSCCLYRDDGSLESCLRGTSGASSPSAAEQAKLGTSPMRMFAFVCRRSGTLEVYLLPSFTKIFTMKGLHLGPALLTPQLRRSKQTAATVSSSGSYSGMVVEAIDQSAEPCEDESQAEVQGKFVKFPRSYIAEISVQRLPQVTMTVVTSNDQTFVYALHAPCEGVRKSVEPPATTTTAAVDVLKHKGAVASTIATMTSGQLVIPKKPGAPAPAPSPSNSSSSSAASSSAMSDPAVGRFVDEECLLQFQRSKSARFVRVTHAPQCPTGVPRSELDPASQQIVEAKYKLFTYPRLRPFNNISGWSGVAILTPVPMWAMSVRGTTAVVNMGVPDVSGAAGSTAIPGDIMFESNIVTAFTPFHAPFCERGFIYAHQGHVQFGALPYPQWPTAPDAKPALPVPSQCFIGQDGAPLALAAGPAVLAAYGSSKLPSASPTSDSADGSNDGASPSSSSTVSRVSVPAPSEDQPQPPPPSTIANILPGPAYTPFFRHFLRCHPYKLSFLDTASGQFGAKTLVEWMRMQTADALAAGKPAPLPATATQLQCCVQPLFAAGIGVKRERDYPTDFRHVEAELAAEGGEYSQVDFGEHVEYAEIPLRSKGVDPLHDGIAADFNAAGLTFPREYDRDHSVALMYGSGADPGTGWTVVDTYKLQHFERVMSIKEVPLTEAAGTKAETAIVVGTGFVTSRGEDLRARGRILVFRIATVVVEAAHVEGAEGADAVAAASAAAVTVPKLKLVYEDDMKTTITAVAALVVKEAWVPGPDTPAREQWVPPPPNGRLARHLVLCTPRRLQVFEWHNQKLRLIAFVETNTWIKDVVIMNEYILFGDAHTSIRLFKWRDEDHQLLSIALDSHRVPLASAGVVVHENSLGMVVSDREGNLQVMQYAPLESRKRLVVRGDFHLGAVTEHMVRSRLAFPLGTPVSGRRTYGSFFGTYHGSIGAVVPLDEMTFKRLMTLQKVLTYCLPHTGGLNPKLWRVFESAVTPGRNKVKNVLDGPLLARYLGLTTHTQKQLAESIGSSVERILSNIKTIDIASMVF